MGESSKLKVSVWNAFVPDTALIMAATSPSASEASPSSMKQLAPENSGLHKEVYGWRMVEDPFGGVVDVEKRNELKQLLLDALSIDLQPSERSIATLRAFVQKSQVVLDSGKVEWSGSQSAVHEDEERRINSLLAFTNHLSWLIDVFEEQPGVSITVR